MSTENFMEFYETLGFEEIDIEDNLTALFCEIDTEGSYALITNDDGQIPEGLRQTIIFAYYTPAGSFEWSVSFKNSYLFRDIWSEPATRKQKLEAIQKHREDSNYY